MEVKDILAYWESEEAQEAHHVDHTGFGFDPGVEHCELCREEIALSEILEGDVMGFFDVMAAIELGFEENYQEQYFTYPWDPYDPMLVTYLYGERNTE